MHNKSPYTIASPLSIGRNNPDALHRDYVKEDNLLDKSFGVTVTEKFIP